VTTHAEHFQENQEELAGWPVKVISYKVGDIYRATVHNLEPGAWIAKAEGATLDEALAQARQVASDRLAKTRVVS